MTKSLTLMSVQTSASEMTLIMNQLHMIIGDENLLTMSSAQKQATFNILTKIMEIQMKYFYAHQKSSAFMTMDYLTIMVGMLFRMRYLDHVQEEYYWSEQWTQLQGAIFTLLLKMQNIHVKYNDRNYFLAKLKEVRKAEADFKAHGSQWIHNKSKVQYIFDLITIVYQFQQVNMWQDFTAVDFKFMKTLTKLIDSFSSSSSSTVQTRRVVIKKRVMTRTVIIKTYAKH